MLAYSIDVIFLLVVVATTILASRGTMVEAAKLWLAVLISSLAAFASFEPIAAWCYRTMFVSSDIGVTRYLWFFWAIFIAACLASTLHFAFSRLLDCDPGFGKTTESIGRWVFSALTGYTLAAFLLTTVHTLPGPRDFWGVFAPEAARRPGPIMQLAPDYQFVWLADFICKQSPESSTSRSEGRARRQPTNPRLIRPNRWGWFPIRYAIWREHLELDDANYSGNFTVEPPETETTAPPANADEEVETQENASDDNEEELD